MRAVHAREPRVVERVDGVEGRRRRGRRELDQLARTRGITVHYLLGRRIRNRDSWLPESAWEWTDEHAMRALVPGITQYDVYVCGPDRWMDAVCATALEIGLPSNQLHQERFSW